ncbi:glycosyltransferase [Sporosarcina sp. SG10008]|uniref:glycosyltransferase n=1 Tax=Sporosarcina sp. SG10008 TaxID=3373103 RepID=UPI0037DD7086
MKVIFSHSTVQNYREALIKELVNKLPNLKIVLTSKNKSINDNFIEINKFKNIESYKSYSVLLYNNFSFSLLKHALIDKYDVWISSMLNSYSTHFVFLISKIRRKKFIIFTEDWYNVKSVRFGLINWYNQIILNNVDALVVASSASREYFLNRGVPDEKIFVALNSTENLSLRRKKTNRFEYINEITDLKILFMNRLEEVKGLDVLLKAIKIVQDSNRIISLFIAGSGSMEKDYKVLADKLKLTNVYFIGKVPNNEIHDLIKEVDIYVHSGKVIRDSKASQEAWGFTINEVISLNKPIISSDSVAASRDLISENINGMIFEESNYTELSEKIKEFSDLPKEEQRKMGANNKFIIDKITGKSQAEKFIDSLNYVEKNEN